VVEHALVGEITGLAVGGGDNVVAGAEVGHVAVGRDVGGVGVERIEVLAGLLGGFEDVLLRRLPLGNHVEEIARGKRSGARKQQNGYDFFHVARILEVILKAEFHHALQRVFQAVAASHFGVPVFEGRNDEQIRAGQIGAQAFVRETQFDALQAQVAAILIQNDEVCVLLAL